MQRGSPALFLRCLRATHEIQLLFSIYPTPLSIIHYPLSIPPDSAAKQAILGLDRAALGAFLAELGEPAFRAKQLITWLHRRRELDFEAMTDLAKPLRASLATRADTRLPPLVSEQTSADGTRKWLLRLACGNAVETVYIPEPERATLCISSQVGCSLNCTFCATARQGYNRNLSSHEIIAQLWQAQAAVERLDLRPVSNIVMMGMGEPLLNLDQVLPALQLMLDDCAHAFPRRRVTVSTAGVVPGIERLSEECPVSLAVSLHAPNDALREQLVPLNRKYPLEVLIPACRRYAEPAGRQVMFEYVMLRDVNDAPEHAKQLARLLAPLSAKLNLIPFNPVPGIPYQCSPPDAIARFRDILLKARIFTSVRRPRGDDIAAACGQLAGEVADRTKRSARMRASPGLA